MNIFWIGLIIIIMFLFYEYRKLEKKYTKILNNENIENIDQDKIINKIFKIESELKEIKNELNRGSKDA